MDVMTNVALDMFLAEDEAGANSTTNATHEIMIWQAATLSHGYNGNNQSVYTWMPETNLTSINVDVAPFIHYLWRKEYLAGGLYLGLLQFGSEAVHSAEGQNITFTAESVFMDIQKGEPKVGGAASVSRPALAVLGAGLLVAACSGLW
ncbi:hypothetical protein H2201_002600 [Coniosporium apollinis]|uniref:Uncharacterized protein n=1 Tax=Coniosporium apollinis TaxID=61459 RepID=A0ABQ9P1I1_9PEZI|nr:hypothetical protein H2201_002600 [Coniosporium apollinis]